MKTNIGVTDRVIRFIVAGIILVLYFSGIVSGTLGIVLLVIAGALVITGIIGFCGLYTLLGFNTCSTDKKECCKK